MLHRLTVERGVEPREIFPFVAYELGYDTVQIQGHHYMYHAQEIVVTAKEAMIASRCKSGTEPSDTMAQRMRKCSPNMARFGPDELKKIPTRQVGKTFTKQNYPADSMLYNSDVGQREERAGNLNWLQTLTCPGDVEMRSGWLASKPCVCDSRLLSTTCLPLDYRQ